MLISQKEFMDNNMAQYCYNQTAGVMSPSEKTLKISTVFDCCITCCATVGEETRSVLSNCRGRDAELAMHTVV